MKRRLTALGVIAGTLFISGCLKLETRQKPVELAALAPPFTLPDHEGNVVSLMGLLTEGPAVVMFYRGYWCVFCRRQLGELTELKPRFDAHGIPLVAISVDGAEESRELIADKGFTVPLLSDPQMKIISAYGVAMEGEDIAVPATFVILPTREIAFKHVGETMADRPSHEELLELAVQLKASHPPPS